MSVSANGTQAAVIGTEHTLATISTAGDYVLIVNLTPMLTGDTVELRVKAKVISAGSLVGLYKQAFADAQPTDSAAAVSIPFRVEHQSQVSLKQTGGTGRSFEWGVWKID